MPITMSWFKNINPYNPIHPLSYIIISVLPTCTGTVRVCAIYAQVDLNNKPIINQALSDEISTSLANRTNSANIMLAT